MTSTLVVTTHRDLAEIAEPEWNRLVRESATRTVFQTKQWHCAWWQVFGTGVELMLLAARDGGELVGIGAFWIDASRVLRFVGHGRSDYADVICAPDQHAARASVWRAVLDARGQWKRVELRYLPADSPSLAMVEALGIPATRIQVMPCPALVLAEDPGVLTRVRAKKSLRRHVGWFRRQAGARVEHSSTAQEIEPWLEPFFDQHRRRWAGTPHPSLFGDSDQCAFYRAVTEHLGPTGWLCFTRLAVGDRSCAFHFGFLYRGTLTWYKPSFEIEMAAKSPGEAMLAELLELVEVRQLRELDFTVGDEPFKRRFTNHVRQNVTVVLFASRWDYQWARALRMCKQWVRRAQRAVRAERGRRSSEGRKHGEVRATGSDA